MSATNRADRDAILEGSLARRAGRKAELEHRAEVAHRATVTSLKTRTERFNSSFPQV
jgi:hypothetical protein